MSADIFDSIFDRRSIIIKLIVKELMAFLIVKMPWLSFSPLSWIVSKIIGIYFDRLFVATVREIKVKINDREKIELANKIDALLKSYEGETDEAKKEAIESRIINDARNLIRLQSSSP